MLLNIFIYYNINIYIEVNHQETDVYNITHKHAFACFELVTSDLFQNFLHSLAR